MPDSPPAGIAGGRDESTRNPWLILLSVAIGLFMVVLDISILNIALPAISSSLHATLSSVEWTLIIYTLALTALVPFFGRISDVMGRRRLFITGLMIFAGASLLAAFSQSILWLIGARLVQAFGGALITANVLAIITDVFPAGKRGTAMGVQAILISGGASMGPIIGGFLVTHFGWQSVFLVNVPIGIVAAIMGFFILPPLKSNHAMEPVDWLGSGLLLAGLTPLLLGVTKGPEWNWSLASIILIVVGLAGLALFILQELRSRYPLVDLSLFKIKEFAAGQAAGTFATIALSTMTLLFPFYWQVLRGYSAETTGIYMLPMPLTLMVAAPLSGRLSDKLGARGIASTGLVLIGIGLFLISQVTATMPVWHVLWRLILFGAGLGMFTAPNNNAVMSSAPPQRRGVASGLLGMFRYSGQSFGIAFAGTVFVTFATAGTFALHTFPSLAQAATADATAAGTQNLATAFMNGMHATALLAIPFAAIGVFLSLLRGKHAPTRPQTVRPAPEMSPD
jgi:EmrB/QacA subfamily drug resistance transporter